MKHSVKNKSMSLAHSSGDANLFQKYFLGVQFGWKRPNANAGLVKTDKIPECNSTNKMTVTHDDAKKIVVNRELSIESCPFDSSNKFG